MVCWYQIFFKCVVDVLLMCDSAVGNAKLEGLTEDLNMSM